MGLKNNAAICLFVGLFLLSGCSSGVYFTIDILKPPEESFLRQKPGLGLVQNTVQPFIDSCKTKYVFENRVGYDTTCRKQSLALAFMTGVKTSIDDSQFFFSSSDTILTPRTRMSKKFDESEILAHFQHYDTDAVLVLEDIKMEDETFFIPVYGYGYACTKAKVTADIRIYDVETGTSVATQKLSGTVYWNSDEILYNDYLYLERSRGEIIVYLAYEAGKQMAEKYVPVWHTVNRMLITANNKALQKSVDAALAGDWERACYFWDGIAKEKKGKAKIAAAYFNKAVYEEINGDFEQALKYAEQADNIYRRNMHRRYIEALEERMELQEQLDIL